MFGKLLTNQKIAHKIVKPYVYKALREGLKLMTTVKYKISEGSIPSLSVELHVIPNVCSEYSEQKIQANGRPYRTIIHST